MPTIMIVHLGAFITNLGKYNEGALVGEWVKVSDNSGRTAKSV